MKFGHKIIVGLILALGVVSVGLSQTDILSAWAASTNTKNFVLATPAAANGAVSLRALVPADLPPQISTGTTFTIASGCATVSALTGGPNAGSFSTTATTCTPVINLPTAPHGWYCQASDITHPVNFTQTATSVNSCTVTATTISGDVIVFEAIGY